MDLDVADMALGHLQAKKKSDFLRTARKFTIVVLLVKMDTCTLCR